MHARTIPQFYLPDGACKRGRRMSTTTVVVRAAIAYVKPGPPAELGRRHQALEETVLRYLTRKQQQAEVAPEQPEEGAAASGSLPNTTTRAFAKERGVRRLERSKLKLRGKAKRNGQ